MPPSEAGSRVRDDLGRGAAFMVASALLFTLMGVGVKLSARTLPNTVVVFFRNALGLIFLAPWLLRLGPGGFSTRHFPEHVARGLAGLGAMYCSFYAIGRMRLADAILINYSLPLFVPFVERAWLGEPVPPRLWRGILLGFLGLVVILRPGIGLFQPVALVALCGALFAAVAQVGVRNLTRTEPVTRVVFFFGVIATTVSAAPAALDWRTPGPAAWLPLLGMGLAATIAQLFLTRAYAQAPAAQVGPFIYSSVVFAGLFDWWLWRVLPDALFLVGALLVCAAGILVLRTARPAAAPAETL
jgi:drug/metabolite transporter (DMT)-like permease